MERKFRITYSLIIYILYILQTAICTQPESNFTTVIPESTTHTSLETSETDNNNTLAVDFTSILDDLETVLFSSLNELEEQLVNFVNESLGVESYEILNGVTVDKINATDVQEETSNDNVSVSKTEKPLVERVMDIYKSFAKTHVVNVQLPQVGRLFKSFGLKKLLLPVFIGAQIVKSVLIAMFLPSILGGLGRLVGKGLSSFSGASLTSQQQQTINDFDFKDNTMYDGEVHTSDQDYATSSDNSYGYPTHTMNKMQSAMSDIPGIQNAISRFGPGGSKVTFLPEQSEFYYSRKPIKQQQDYKVFHKIPSSSLLLTSYDPFYSPLLSRLDAIFKQMGHGTQSEKCRERLVCLMYANPAKYAPYSNLISAQLSRELNELRKPTSDNPDILRFFKYMKAAKDGQDGPSDCPLHKGCPELLIKQESPAMLKTYNDINKLVQARKFN